MTEPADLKIRKLPHLLSTATAQRLSLIAILILSAVLNFYHLDRVGSNGYGNIYYAAAVKTMLSSWRYFFYLALDPAGFVSVDKPPLALWIQTANARLFGFHGLSLLLPQAIAGIVAVYLLYRLVARGFGRWAGLLAALTLAIMPVSVVTARSNMPDALMILALLLAASAIMRSIEQGSLRWLLIGAVLVGIAFNIKMLQIVLIVPALTLCYLLASGLPWSRRLAHAGAALLVTLAVSAPWVLAVELTPATQRPYVGGSADNSVVSLMFGYNGFARLWQEDWTVWLGPTGPLRLFNKQIGGQASWLLPFALLGLIATIWRLRHSPTAGAEGRVRRAALILWTTWLILPAVYFSISTYYHSYYLATMAPGIAALVGIGADALWRAWHSSGWRRSWMLIALLSTAGVQAVLLLPYPGWRERLIPLIAGLTVLAAIVFFLVWLMKRTASGWPSAAMLVGVLALLIAPVVWTMIPVATCVNMTLPAAGPQPVDCWTFEIKPFLDPELVNYLYDHREGARFLAATYDSGIAMLGILETGEPFLAVGGYRGSDPILTTEQFVRMVADGEVRFFFSLTQDTESFPQQEGIKQWVQEHCPESPVQSQGVAVRGPCAATE